MRRLLLCAIVLLVLPAAGCEDAAELVDDATDQVGETAELVEFCANALQLVNALRERDYDAAVGEVEELQDSAPAEIRADVDTVASAVQAFQDGDEQAVQTDEFGAATDAVVAYTRDNCDPR